MIQVFHNCLFVIIRCYCSAINFFFKPKHSNSNHIHSKPPVQYFNNTIFVEDNDGYINVIQKATPCQFRFLNVTVIISNEEYVLYLNRYFLEGNEWNKDFFVFLLQQQHKIQATSFLIVICDHEYRMNHIDSEQLKCIKFSKLKYEVLLLF